MKQIYTFVILGVLMSCGSKEKNDNTSIPTSNDQELIVQMMSNRFLRFQNSPEPVDQARIYCENLTNDAVWMPQNGKLLRGKEEIQKWAEWFFSNYILVLDPERQIFDEVEISDNLAVRRFTSGGHYVIKATGDSVAFDQKYEDVFKKENGEWEIASHVWSSNNKDKSVWNPDCPIDGN